MRACCSMKAAVSSTDREDALQVVGCCCSKLASGVLNGYAKCVKVIEGIAILDN